MQVRQSLFRKEEGCPQPGCTGLLHHHGSYSRYASPEGEEQFAVPRYCCTRCGLTTSVLPEERLPYRSLTTTEVEEEFDRRSQELPAAAPPRSEKKGGCFDRAWTAWQRNSRRLVELVGLGLDRSALDGASQAWRALREGGSSLPGILAELWLRFKTSLLRDYRCLKPTLCG
jgi:hypothetical protein